MIRRITGRLQRALVLVMVLSLVLPYVAFADSLEDHLQGTASVASASPGGTGASVGFKLMADGPCDVGTTGDNVKATIQWSSLPAGITVSPTTVQIDECGKYEYATFMAADTVALGDYAITDASVTGITVGVGNNKSEFTLRVAKADTALNLAKATGTYGGSATLSATLNSGGTAVANKSVAFTLNGASAGTATTDASGVASLSASLSGINAGTYASGVGASFASDSTYNASSGSNSLTVNKAPVTITPDSGQSKVYGAVDPALSFSNDGSLADSSFTGALARATGESVGSYAINLGNLSAGSNYVLSLPETPVNFAITARLITVTADAKSKTYGEADPDLTYQVTSGSLLQGDSFSGALSREAGQNVGRYAIQQGTLTAGSNYDLTYVGATFTISEKSVTGSFTAANKTYDGNTNADISSRSLTGVVDGDGDIDSVSLSGGTASFANKNVGQNKAVSGTGFTLSGTDAGNYSLASSSLSTTANITPKALTGSFTANNKTYDGTRTATVAGTSLPGKIEGDAVRLEVANPLFADKNVGTGKDVTGDLSLSGTDAGNYTVNASHTAKANITKKALTGNFTAANKPYDGNADAKITGSSLVASDVITDDNVILSGDTASASFADKNVGTGKTVSSTGFVLTGRDAGNYSLSMNTATANITAKNLTISGTVADNKPYDGNADATVNFDGASLSGVVEGDTVKIDSSRYFASFADKNVGTGKAVTVTGVALGEADAGNYTVSQPSGLTANITAKAVTGSFTADNKVYDGTTAASVLSRSLTGAIDGDGVSLDGGTASFDTKHVGNGKTVTLSGATLSGTDANNYRLTSVDTTKANITARPITVTADPKSKTYGEADPALTYQISGSLVEGDSLSDSLTRDEGENAGQYNINQGSLSAGSNYDLTYVGAKLTINKADQSITFGQPADKIYGDPAFEVSATATSGLVVSFSSQTTSVCTVSGNTVTIVKSGTCTIRASQAGNGNYNAAPNVDRSFNVASWTVLGFYAPIDKGIHNTVKSGATVPLKFEIFAGAAGVNEQTSTSVVTMSVRGISCDGTIGEDAVTETTSGSTSLRYDTTSGQYIYNWQTPSKRVGYCYEVTATAADGSKVSATFKLK